MGAENFPIIGPLFQRLSKAAGAPVTPTMNNPVDMNAGMNGMDVIGSSSSFIHLHPEMEGDPWEVATSVAVGHVPTGAAASAQGTAFLPGGPNPSNQVPIYERIQVNAQGPKADVDGRPSHHMQGFATISTGRRPGLKQKKK